MSLFLSARPEGEDGWRVKVTEQDSGRWAEFDERGTVTSRCEELNDPAVIAEWGRGVQQFLRRGPP